MVRGFNVSSAQVNGSDDTWSEQSRPLLQVEDIRAATGGDYGLPESRDWGFFTVAMPNFWERPEMSGMLRDVRLKPDKYDWLKSEPLALPAPTPSSSPPPAAMNDPDAAILQILASLETGKSQ
ncbi:hypothetical protein BBF93_15940 [Hyphomonas sp. CACIAM 19H1]|uniref:hypothetical protein n=1 Tax=Hyphomonas sp. CACIAM 19H1 TaxID=1873716 RepID=UPI000DF071DE|nr:hypothetical protein [Hyphomonas sp. CACIAM 19H1]AXE65553.1 hypothetical protein BBF93_15940 [Hyphomonas sp. CACIAM 19H1]